MKRASCLGIVLMVMLAGCRISEREGQNPLPENAAPLSYADMMNRARGQASSALDAFYIDAWLDLEQSAQRLEQTARLLPKTTHIPEAFQSKIQPESEQLRQDAGKLLEAARARNAGQVNEAMQRINLRIRQLRPTDRAEKLLESK
jgi:phosphatidylserine/phosphatidylglycerophosphate/cardiolipin synthase-like enzyme